jgi:hypothetical protein
MLQALDLSQGRKKQCENLYYTAKKLGGLYRSSGVVRVVFKNVTMG